MLVAASFTIYILSNYSKTLRTVYVNTDDNSVSSIRTFRTRSKWRRDSPEMESWIKFYCEFKDSDGPGEPLKPDGEESLGLGCEARAGGGSEGAEGE